MDLLRVSEPGLLWLPLCISLTSPSTSRKGDPGKTRISYFPIDGSDCPFFCSVLTALNAADFVHGAGSLLAKNRKGQQQTITNEPVPKKRRDH
ncbi:unnamed protein product [Haemonchus placei]|uniref:Secreted protein n=1 Tax=Haemonchus placei TaxID=6290 RepID=A0A0N4VX05_HAEPC|nr:unnamed protein product [Haemonchus placei]